MRGFLVQSGSTPYETLIDGDPMSLRYYPVPHSNEIEMADGERVAVRRKRHPVPLLLVPPLGVTTEVFDLLPQRSLVRYMAARGFHTYLVDWGKPERRHALVPQRAKLVSWTPVRIVPAVGDAQAIGLGLGPVTGLDGAGLELGLGEQPRALWRYGRVGQGRRNRAASSMASDRIVASGLAMPLPAMSGALPCTGS